MALSSLPPTLCPAWLLLCFTTICRLEVPYLYQTDGVQRSTHFVHSAEMSLSPLTGTWLTHTQLLAIGSGWPLHRALLSCQLLILPSPVSHSTPSKMEGRITFLHYYTHHMDYLVIFFSFYNLIWVSWGQCLEYSRTNGEVINGFKCHRDKEDQTESNEKESGEAARHEARGKKEY